LQGTRDSPLLELDSAYIFYEFLKCTDATKLDGYPDCAPQEKIEEYLEKKKIGFKVIN